MTAPGVADVRIRWVDGHSVGLGHWCGFGSLAVMGRSIAATARGASADSSRRCQSPNLRRECHLGWTFRGPRALRPLRPGATTNPERWLWTSLLTLKESASSGGPPDFREFPKSIAIRRVNSSRPPPAKSKEKPARLGRRVRVLPLVVSSNHLAESVALPPIRGKASCPNLKAFRPPFHSLQLRAPLVRSARPG